MTAGPVFSHTVDAVPSVGAGPVFAHVVDAIPSTAAGPVFDHQANPIPGVGSGPVYSHAVVASLAAAGPVYSHEINATIAPLITPLDPAVATPVPESKIVPERDPFETSSPGVYGVEVDPAS